MASIPERLLTLAFRHPDSESRGLPVSPRPANGQIPAQGWVRCRRTCWPWVFTAFLISKHLSTSQPQKVIMRSEKPGSLMSVTCPGGQVAQNRGGQMARGNCKGPISPCRLGNEELQTRMEGPEGVFSPQLFKKPSPTHSWGWQCFWPSRKAFSCPLRASCLPMACL